MPAHLPPSRTKHARTKRSRHNDADFRSTMPSVVSVEKTVGGGGRGRAPLSNLTNRSFPTSTVQVPCQDTAQKPRSTVRTSPGDFENHAAAAIVLASLAGAAPSDPAPSGPPSAPPLLPIVNQQGGGRRGRKSCGDYCRRSRGARSIFSEFHSRPFFRGGRGGCPCGRPN